MCLRPKKIPVAVVPVTCHKKLGSVGRKKKFFFKNLFQKFF